jgi:nitrite reductase/ring-hydroxylating ferredoxin subunit
MGPGRTAARCQVRSLATMSRALCRFDDLREGQSRSFGPFEGMRAKIFVVRKDGKLYAYWDACPHYGHTPMAWRTDAYLNAAGNRIVCSSHGSEFEIEGGRCLHGAALGKGLTPAVIELTGSGEVILKS